MKLHFGSDHAGFIMKSKLIEHAEKLGHDVVDHGPANADRVDYPDFADKVADAIKRDPAARGVLVCGTGIGISIAANRHREVRAALCRNSTDAKLTRAHNDANIIALGERVTGIEVAMDCLESFLETEFEGGRHVGRIAKMS